MAPPVYCSGCTMISEPDASPNRLDGLEHGLEVARANLDPIKSTVFLDGNPVAVSEFSEAVHVILVMDFTGDKFVHELLEIRHNSSLSFQTLIKTGFRFYPILYLNDIYIYKIDEQALRIQCLPV